jgi:hypothetical protein
MKEIIYWGLVNVAYLIIGIVYFFFQFNLKDFSTENIGADKASSNAA